MVLATSLFSLTSIHAANVTSNLNVSATVEKACYINNLSNVNFQYFPEATQDLIQNISFKSLFNIKCTNGLFPLLSISGSTEGDNNQRQLTGADNQKLNYTLTFNDGQGSNFGHYGNSINDGNGSEILQSYQNGNTFDPDFFLEFKFPKGQFVKGQNYNETITVNLSY